MIVTLYISSASLLFALFFLSLSNFLSCFYLIFCTEKHGEKEVEVVDAVLGAIRRHLKLPDVVFYGSIAIENLALRSGNED